MEKSLRDLERNVTKFSLARRISDLLVVLSFISLKYVEMLKYSFAKQLSLKLKNRIFRGGLNI